MQLILGTAQLTATYGVRQESVSGAGERPTEFLHTAERLGFIAVDTAPSYGNAEVVIGEAETSVEIHTKIPDGVDPLESIDGSLKRLRRNMIDLAYLHDPDASVRDGGSSIDTAVRATSHCVRGIGVSVYDGNALDAALERDDLAAIQIPVSVLAPHLVEKPVARPAGLRLIARSVLCQGVVLLDPDSLPRQLAPLAPSLRSFHRCCHDLGRSPLEVAVLWANGHPTLDGIVLGAGSTQQLLELAEVLGKPPLTPEERAHVAGIDLPSARRVDPRFWSSPSQVVAEDESRPRVVAVVQARLGSLRFPEKVLAEISGQPALLLLLTRLRRATSVDAIVVALPDASDNDKLDDLVRSWGYDTFRGPEHDVLARYIGASVAAAADVVVRITGDCPFVDPGIVDSVASTLITTGSTYVSTSERFPDGFDVEAVDVEWVRRAGDVAVEPADREHVTPWVRRNAPAQRIVDFEQDLSHGRVTLDERDDLTVLRAVADRLGSDDFSIEDVVALMNTDASLFDANRHLLRNEGASMGTGQKLWRRAKEVIPGGNMLLSKRAEQFLPEGWPSYFSRAFGCRVWDLDGIEYLDMGLMGVGTNILGYAYPSVDQAVRRVIAAGNLSTLNCPEEVALAERLCELHPWADMAKFTRSGGEANAIAIRIARAATGRDAVAICGYHGWHDWYLSANLADQEALDGHLLPGLDPRGVPRRLAGLTRPFLYNDLAALEDILSSGDVGAIMMEVERSVEPAPGFLEGVRRAATRHQVPLIFDECTSGFRKVVGGIHLHHGVEPDLAIFGKTLGNGYAINAVIGRREIMEYATSTFISSTFWTERIGPTAALATLDAMVAEDAPRRIDEVGGRVRAIWSETAASSGLQLAVTGLPALSTYSALGLQPEVVRPIVIGALLDSKILGGPFFYASIAHKQAELERYAEAVASAFRELAERFEELAAKLPDNDTAIGFGRLA